MFKTYNTLAEVPEADREHYIKNEKTGKYVPEVSDDHPLVTYNTTLLSEKNTAEEKARTAEANLESARASGLPRGHEAVPKADADLLRAVKESGITKPEDFTLMKSEHATFKTKVAAQERREHLDAVRKAEGWGDGAVDVLSLIQDLPEIEQRDTDERDEKGAPKKKNIAKVKGADGVVTEKPFADYFAERHAALLPSVTVKSEGTPLPSHGAGGGSVKTTAVDSYLSSVDAAPKPRQAAA